MNLSNSQCSCLVEFSVFPIRCLLEGGAYLKEVRKWIILNSENICFSKQVGKMGCYLNQMMNRYFLVLNLHKVMV